MKLPKLKWHVVTITLALTLVTLFAAHWLWQRNAVQGPLQGQLLQIEGIEKVELVSERGTLTVKIGLTGEADFGKVASGVLTEISKHGLDHNSEIEWLDQPNERLETARTDLNLALREAQRRYEFVILHKRINEILGGQIDFQLSVDEQFIYLKLQDGQHNYLEVLPLLVVGR